ncbi:MAG: HEAT repeat domain-containing protein [Planctomycetes bacterium]|nr:HEAT repeat domain-containing protein [Planctomycetota bacterium]
MPKQVPSDHPLARTFALLDPDFAPAAAATLQGTTDPVAIDGLVELLLDQRATAAACSTALRSLEHDTGPLVSDAVVRALDNQYPTIRIQAAAEVVRRGLFDLAANSLDQHIRTDPFWQVRRAAVNALGADPTYRRWLVMFAATDPHWRVRYALAHVLVGWGYDETERATVLELLPETHSRVVRLRDYLAFRWTGDLPPERPSENPAEWCPFWDWDPAVLSRQLGELGNAGRRESLHILTRLVNHADERVRAWVIQALRDDGDVTHWADALARLGDPREDTAPPQADLVKGLELDRLEAVARFILSQASPEPAALSWALRQLDESFPAEEVQTDLERLGVQTKTPPQPLPQGERGFKPGSSEPLSPWGRGWGGVVLANHPHSRAASLTPERARELIENPTLETSWFVLGHAAKMCRVPVWKLAPETEWKPPAEPREPATSLALPLITLVRPRRLGPGGPFVSPLGLSGHYGLPVEGFARATEAGVNLFFWEPNYATLTRFVTRLSPADRQQIHLLAGTFEAEPTKIRKDVERALRNLKLDRLSVFLIFWTQSWQRITPDVRDVLERLKSEGKVQVFGLSTHSRPLAAEAIREGWNPVMVRHSAAHRKAETEVFPLAIERGTSILTFNNTCYGRLLDDGQFRPSDCFRFTLNTPGVSACFTAPSTLEYLDENLDALRNPELADDVRERLLKRGEWMYREDTVFRKTVRADG